MADALLSLPVEDRQEALRVAADRSGRPAHLFEKDVGRLAEACGDRFAFGVVLYESAYVVPFGDRLAASPLSNLWDGNRPVPV